MDLIDISKEEEIKAKDQTIIIAPHPDDEVIGCFELLNDKSLSIMIIYTTDVSNLRREEALKLRDKTSIKAQLFQRSIPSSLFNESNTFYCPDPSYEIHPEHREWGHVGESMARNGLNVIFYNTSMIAPYIHDVGKAEDKKKMLDEFFPSQKTMWKYDHRYFLFEGRCKWIF